MRSEPSLTQQYGTICSRILSQLGQLQQVLRNSLWVFRPLYRWSVPYTDDVIDKASARAGLGSVQESHCTEGHWQIHSETLLEDVVVVVGNQRDL